MSITADDQKLEPGNQITLFEVDGTAFGADVLYFHNHAVAYTEEEVLAAGDDESKLPGKPIYWQGIRYDLWPCQIEDIEANGDGTPVSPKLSVGNLDGSISALCHLFQDMKSGKGHHPPNVCALPRCQQLPGRELPGRSDSRAAGGVLHRQQNCR